MRERDFFASVLSIFTFLMVLFGRLASKPVVHTYHYPASTIVTKAMSNSNNNNVLPKSILCFGDSLTAGTSPPRMENYPYAPHLERLLRERYSWNVVVHHVGYPGWTSGALLSELPRLPDNPPAVAILLAGTNDLAYETDPSKIVGSIVQLHEACHQQGIPHTVAIAIPPSGYQSQYPQAAELAATVNQQLAQYCHQKQQQRQQQRLPTSSSFVEFPFAFDRQDERWSPDGLHFAPIGYQSLAESLAPIVADILAGQQQHQQQ